MHNTELIYGVRFHLQRLNITLSTNLTNKNPILIFTITETYKILPKSIHQDYCIRWEQFRPDSGVEEAPAWI